MPDTKICRSCDIEKPIDDFYKEGRPNAAGVRMPTGSCKVCIDLRKRTAGAADRANRKAQKIAAALQKADLPRECRTCKVEKPTSDFYAKGVLKSGATRYRPDCIACTIAALDANPQERERIRSATAGWREEDPDRGRKSCLASRNRHLDERHATQKANRVDPDKRPIILAQARGSYERNREQRIADSQAYDAAHPGYRRAYNSAYSKGRPDKGREHRNKRRCRLAGLDGLGFTETDIQRQFEKQGGLCANPYCMADLDIVGYAADHIIPVNNRGPNTPANMHLLCHPKKGSGYPCCNSQKRDKDWIRFLRDYAKKRDLPWPPPGMEGDLEDVLTKDFAISDYDA